MEVIRRKKHQREEENVQKPRQKGRKPQPETYLPNYQETLVHYHKSFGVLQELFDHRDFLNFEQEIHDCAAAASTESLEGPRFLDLGCAPGGFAACLLQDHMLGPMSVGYGVSLPPQLGGFQMAVTTSRLCVQFEDLLQINSCDLMCIDNSIDICVADAQYLSNMFKPQHQAAKYRGMKTRNRTLGIWALTVKECQLAFAKLRQSGSFIFRFGWRGVGTSDVHPTGEPVHPSLLAKYLQEEEWYTALTHWLFSVLKSLFSTLRPFKSEYVHQADVSFYMVCRNFDREKFALCGWEAKLQRAYHELTNCEDEATLVAGLKESINQDTKLAIDELLDYVGRMRAIGIQSRKVTNPSALGWKSDSNSQKEKDEKEKDDKEKEQMEKEEEKVEDKEEKVTVTPSTVVKSDASTELEERSESSTGTEVRGAVIVPTPPPPPRSGPKPPGRCVSQPMQRERREIRSKPWGKGTGKSNGFHKPKPKDPPAAGEWSSTWAPDLSQISATGGEGRSWDSGSQWPAWDASDFEAKAMNGHGDWSFGEVYDIPLFTEFPLDLDHPHPVHGFEAMYELQAQNGFDTGHVHPGAHMENGFMCEETLAMHEVHEPMMMETLAMHEVHEPMMEGGAVMHQDGMDHAGMMQEMWCQGTGLVPSMAMTAMNSMTSWAPAYPASLPPPPAAPPVLAAEVLGAPPERGSVAETSKAVSSRCRDREEPTVPEPQKAEEDGSGQEVFSMREDERPNEELVDPPVEEAYDVSEEEDEARIKRRRKKKDRDRERRTEHPRGPRDRTVLRAIRIMHKEGKGYQSPWYRRVKGKIRAAVLDIHEDSLQALRFGICFAMAWSFCSLVMSMIRFSSQRAA